MRIQTGQLVSLGYGKYVRSDDVVAVARIEEGRGPGRRTLVWIRGVADPIEASLDMSISVEDMEGEISRRVLDLVRSFVQAEKPVAAICHGAQLLSAAGVVGGRKLQAYPAIKPELIQAGAVWEEPSAALDSVCVDGRFVTSPAWPAHSAWMRAYLAQLEEG